MLRLFDYIILICIASYCDVSLGIAILSVMLILHSYAYALSTHSLAYAFGIRWQMVEHLVVDSPRFLSITDT